MEALVQQLVESNLAQQAMHRELMEERHQTSLLRAELSQLTAAQAGRAAGPTVSSPKPSLFILKLTEKDDIEAYLQAFERTAAREEWPPEQWASLLAPFLSGSAQRTYQDLAVDQATNYDVLKKEILRRYGFNLISRAQRFHDWTYDATAPPRAQMHDLIRLTKSWLTAEPLTLTPIEKVVIDKFLRALPFEAKKLASQANPQSADQLVELVEGQQVALEVLRSGQTRKNEPSPRQKERKRTEDHAGRLANERGSPTACSQRQRPFLNLDGRKCYECGEPGHIAWYCPNRDVSMPTASASEVAVGRPCNLLTTCWAAESGPSPVTPVRANGKDTTALVDSGSMATLIRPEFAQSPPLTDTVPITCIHGETKYYPTTLLHQQTAKGQSTGPVGIVPNLPVPVLIGRDCPMFRPLWASMSGDVEKRGNQKRGSRKGGTDSRKVKARMCGFQEVDPQVSTGAPSEGESGEASQEEGEASLNDMFPMDPEVEPEPASLAGRFGTAQLEDPNLAHALQQVTVVDGKPMEGLTHSHLLGAHLGVEKTLDRIKARFYWPGVKRAVEDYCRSCPECQMVAPKPHFRSPLVPMPIISVPFSRIAMDLVGPLPKSNRGHQYILVILDYATRYPEAIPLRTMATKGIARELVMLFSRVGIPDEILTDQGTPFMSRIMKDLCKLMKITQLRTSVYHPQTDGLVERFNRTLKQMLKKVMEADGRNWDQLLPYLMFSIREVPQASTGFSPFELLYGRRPRGLLDVAKEAWEQQPSPHRTMVEHVEDMRGRMTTLWPLVREHMREAQEAQSQVYNRGAQPRDFQPGDKVLVLSPTSECKFLARWNGPYEVLEKIGDVNYKVRQPGRRHLTKIYHVNLLKKWNARDVLYSFAPRKATAETKLAAVPMGDQLSSVQR
ncbi:hypothetical protein PFLUV_G00065720 [Perca fluviatilis]|uniref:Gypsy retrotransposon integrase-like protein 1 n=1 Tax=Perca fluviatilis TaxID=8168 RepID=A0A6A5FD08_PERFL|nr:hypothetical protein PFLUV_G00065720 [Perca fluviatilis]